MKPGESTLQTHARQGRIRAFVIALAIHGLLAAFLFFGVRWNTQEPAPIQVEVFTPPATNTAVITPQAAVEPKPEVQAQPKEEQTTPKIETKVENKVDAKAESKVEPTPELILQKQREEKRLKEERAEQIKREAKKDAERAAKVEAKEEAKKAEAKKQADQLKAQEQAQKQAELDQQARVRELQKQAQSQSATSKVSGETAVDGSKTGSIDAGYVGRLRSVIQRNTRFPESSVSNIGPAQFLVELNPDCSQRNVKLTKASRSSAWDQAAERAIRNTDPFPKPSNGNCPASITVTHDPERKD
jgi:colicin import membrane protein